MSNPTLLSQVYRCQFKRLVHDFLDGLGVPAKHDAHVPCRVGERLRSLAHEIATLRQRIAELQKNLENNARDSVWAQGRIAELERQLAEQSKVASEASEASEPDTS